MADAVSDDPEFAEAIRFIATFDHANIPMSFTASASIDGRDAELTFHNLAVIRARIDRDPAVKALLASCRVDASPPPLGNSGPSPS